MKRKVLVAYATKSGATAEIAEAVADEIRNGNLEVDLAEASKVESIDDYDAVIVGSAVYFDHWRPEAVRFLRHFRRKLTLKRVWLFQDGPLEQDFIESMRPLPHKVLTLADEIGVIGSVTFGGRLPENASGPIAGWIAKTYAGDYRDFDEIRKWASAIGAKLTGRSSESDNKVIA